MTIGNISTQYLTSALTLAVTQTGVELEAERGNGVWGRHTTIVPDRGIPTVPLPA